MQPVQLSLLPDLDPAPPPPRLAGQLPETAAAAAAQILARMISAAVRPALPPGAAAGTMPGEVTAGE
jgi:hypothetical protein